MSSLKICKNKKKVRLASKCFLEVVQLGYNIQHVFCNYLFKSVVNDSLSVSFGI